MSVLLTGEAASYQAHRPASCGAQPLRLRGQVKTDASINAGEPLEWETVVKVGTEAVRIYASLAVPQLGRAEAFGLPYGHWE